MDIITTPYGKVSERARARIIDDNDTSPRAETTWMVWDCSSDVNAYLALNSVVPVAYEFVISGQVGVLINLAVKEIGERSTTDREYEAQAIYGVRAQSEDIEYSFVAGSQSVQLTHSLGTVGYTGGGRGLPDFKGGINISPQGEIQGISVERPRFTFAVTKHWLRDDVTTSYQLQLSNMVGTVNNAIFYGLPIGSVKLNSASGSPKGKRFPVKYEFEYSAPESGVVVSDITGISREGWQYLDVYRRTIDAEARKTLDIPHSVYIHAVYPYSNFALLGL